MQLLRLVARSRFEPAPRRGKSRSPLEPHKDWLLGLVAQKPDLTLQELERRIREGVGLVTSERSIRRFFKRHRISFKVAGVRKLIEAANATLIYLPSYSPDLNPIEMAFAKLKTLLRKAAARTRDALWDSIGTALTAFTPHECANYFRHAGYASP